MLLAFPLRLLLQEKTEVDEAVEEEEDREDTTIKWITVSFCFQSLIDTLNQSTTTVF